MLGSRTRWTAALAVVAAGLLTACSGGGGTGTDAGLPRLAQPSMSSSADDSGSGRSTSGGGRAAAAPQPTAAGRPRTGVTVAPQALIRTAALGVEVPRARDVAARAEAAGVLAVGQGGEVDADQRNGGRYASATVRLRVPPQALAATLRTLSTYGRVSSRELGARDVTGQVADVTSRVASAQRAIVRLRTLYDSASRVTDVIAIENQLSSRESDLESLQAQQRTLSGQVTLATVTLSLRVAPRATTTPPSEDRSGFLGGLSSGWDAFVDAAGATAKAVGAALPFAVLLLVVAAGVRLVVRVLVRRRRPTRPAPLPTP